jgi:hypothetical protein
MFRHLNLNSPNSDPRWSARWQKIQSATSDAWNHRSEARWPTLLIVGVLLVWGFISRILLPFNASLAKNSENSATPVILAIVLLSLFLIATFALAWFVTKRLLKKKAAVADQQSTMGATVAPSKKAPSKKESSEWSLGGAIGGLFKLAFLIAMTALFVGILVMAGGATWQQYKEDRQNSIPVNFPGHERQQVADQNEDHGNDDPRRPITVGLRNHGYHGLITLPRCWDTFGANLDEAPYAWYSVWRSDEPAPRALHKQNGEYKEFDYRANFRGTFFLEGNGTMIFVPTRLKPNCQ